jgi:twitching motility two-component system response regulator PilH
MLGGTAVGVFQRLRSIFGTTGPEQVPEHDLPTVPLHGPVHVDRRVRPRQDARNGTRVLIIDDSRTIVTAFGKILRPVGYTVLEAFDAEAGLERARAERVELIFLDIILPGMNGFAALRALRRDPLTRQIPVIMISGNEQATEQFYGQRIGADDFMKKPFSRFEIFTRIERLLDADLIPRRVSAVQGQSTPALPRAGAIEDTRGGRAGAR